MNRFEFCNDGRSNPASLQIEMVERKGLGHPDTLADAIAEETSRRYSSYCLGRFGAIAHHWFDKVMLIGGEADISFSAGWMIRPVRAILAGKAVRAVGNDEIPLMRIFEEAVAAVFDRTLKNFHFEKYCVCELQVHDTVGPGQRSIRYRPKSASEMKEFESDWLVSNDCNICVGFAPYTATELLSLELEQFLLSPQQQSERPWLGSDIKTVVTRVGAKTHVLANIPMLASHVESFATYVVMREALESQLKRYCSDFLRSDCEVVVNPEWKHDRAYLTATGTCLDTGDIGVVGRGNRHSGLITPMRSMSIEASAGKNPLDHTGKLLNVAASVIAERAYRELKVASTVYIFAKKGDRVEMPSIVAVYCDADAAIPANCANLTEQIASDVLANLDAIRASLLAGTARVF
jgi:S-adenosylmethionine synthetase